MPIQQIFLGAGGAAEETYWYSELQDTSVNFKTNNEDGIGVDSAGNVYGAFRGDPGTGTYTVNLTKWNKKGALQWQKSVNLSVSAYRRGSLHVDSSDNIYLIGMAGTSTGDGMFIFKFASDGTLTWQRNLAAAGETKPHSMATDSSGNLYITGQMSLADGTSEEHTFTAKYNSSGTLQWCKHFTVSGTGDVINDPQGIGVDSSGNVYITCRGHFATRSYYKYGILVQLDSSGAEQWNRSFLRTSSNSTYGHGLTVDSSDYVYVGMWSSTYGYAI